MQKSKIDELLSRVHKQATAQEKVRAIIPKRQEIQNVPDDDDDDGDEYTPVGVKGLISASQKLLAINRGLDNTDERDSMQFKRIMTTDRLLAEGVKLDSGRVRGSIIPLIAKHRNLKAVGPFAFDSYMEKFLTGNSLSSPLEEINPLHLLEQARRSTQMGQGGIGTEQAITEGMQSIATDQFGFLSPIEGPECLGRFTSVFTYNGWIPVLDVNYDTLLACNVDGKLEFHNPTRIVKYHYTGDMIRAEHSNILMHVTPTHRVYYATDPQKDWSRYRVKTAEELYGKCIRVPCWHLPYEGKLKDQTTFDLPGVGNVSIEDFCSFMGWFLSEGNIGSEEAGKPTIAITQCSVVNPDCFKEIEDLLNRMNLRFSVASYSPQYSKSGEKNGFRIYNHDLHSFLLSYIPGGRLCYEKGFPEELLEYSVEARKALLHALMQGDGRLNKTHTTYCTTSYQLALGVERLMISLGYPCRIHNEPDKRAHVDTMNYCVAQFKIKEKSIWGKSYGHKNYPGRAYGNHWSKEPYNDMVYCATVPGSKLFVRGSAETQGFWTGNSEKIGIDSRHAYGSKIGSNGRPYQRFFDRRSGKFRWMSPEDLDGLTVKLPD